jgi:hypothetical protein
MTRASPASRLCLGGVPTTATYDGRQIAWAFTESSRFHGATKLRKNPSFHTSWESLNRHDPNHPHSLPSDSVFIEITSSCWRNERQNWEIPTFTCARRVAGCSNLQHTTWLSYNTPRNSNLIRQHDYICSHGLTFIINQYHTDSDNLPLHFNPLNAELNPICHLLALLGAHQILHVSRIRVKNSSCYLEVTEYVRNMFIICVWPFCIVLFCGNSRNDQLGTKITNGH